MRAEEVAKEWGMSTRQVYRLIKDGSLPATTKPRDRPVYGYEVERDVVLAVKKRLNGESHPNRGLIKAILQQIAGL